VGGETGVVGHGTLGGACAFGDIVSDGSGVLAHAIDGVAGGQAKCRRHQEPDGGNDAAGSGNHLLHLQEVSPTTDDGVKRLHSNVTLAVPCGDRATTAGPADDAYRQICLISHQTKQSRRARWFDAGST